jgi:L-ascorbate metabolism protein UlaG (beta-lactamase superfamily)
LVFYLLLLIKSLYLQPLILKTSSMKKIRRKIVFLFFMCFSLLTLNTTYSEAMYEKDTISTSDGDLIISFIGHASLMFEFKNLTIHIDPVMQEGDYSKMPKADLIIVTHEHFDHLDLTAIKHLTKAGTKLIVTNGCVHNTEYLSNADVMENGDKTSFKGIIIKAVPAYNIKHKRADGNPFHPKGQGNGYILSFGNTNVYVAGDTENIPEMKDLTDIDIAFLPMNLPYTMTPEMVAEAARVFKPKILYPYHYGNTNTRELVNLLKANPEIEVRIRDLK